MLLVINVTKKVTYQTIVKFLKYYMNQNLGKRPCKRTLLSSESEAWSKDSLDDGNPQMNELVTTDTMFDKSKDINVLTKEKHLQLYFFSILKTLILKPITWII